MAQLAFQKNPKGGRNPRRAPKPIAPQGGGDGGTPWPALVGFVGLCLLVGLSAAAFNQPAIEGTASWYASLVRPPLTPPNWLFGPVWTVLHVMIGTSAWLIWWKAPQGRRQTAALQLWGWQLLLNAAWSPAFFGLHSPATGLLVIVPLGVLITLTIIGFLRLNRIAGLLLVPYLGWSLFATYLNVGFWWLNR
jgi:tryptophan-rich sensory protein